MKMSSMMLKTEHETPAEAELTSHRLLLRSGMIRQLASGIYGLTPLGWRALQRIATMAREEMNRIEGQEVLLPLVHPASIWRETGRYHTVDESLSRFQDRGGQDLVLAMTHEEAVTDMARHVIESHRQLPMMVYQIQTKFRDEARPRGGLIRLREFIMKDAYSFHADEGDLDAYYEKVKKAYVAFYTRCGIDVLQVNSDTGMMGGGVAHEFMMLAECGEDTLLLCDACHRATNREVYQVCGGDETRCLQCGEPVRAVRGIEVGNIFQLGSQYSLPMHASFTDSSGVRRPVVMGCYGIGISRMLACVIEANHDAAGIIWPESVAPYAAHLVTVGTSSEVIAVAERVYASLADHVLWDDRDASAGRKFQDADLLGMPKRLTISPRSLAAGGIELRSRRTGAVQIVPVQDMVAP